jgi:hypothetical protein
MDGCTGNGAVVLALPIAARAAAISAIEGVACVFGYRADAGRDAAIPSA